MSADTFSKVDEMKAAIEADQPGDLQALEQFRIKYLGSKNVIKALFGEIRNIPNEQKKEYGQRVNAVKEAAEAKYNSLKQQLETAAEEAAVKDIDLTAPGEPIELGSRHPIAVTMNRIIRIFERIGFVVADDREIEDDWHNFTAMNTPEDHPARDMQDTFYLQNSMEMLLRTHTSSVQARVMKHTQPPIRIIAPGRVYRNETVSARSHCQFHQVEGLYVDENVSFADLKQTLLYFAREMFGPDAQIRLRPSYFPFTEPSAEMDVYLGTETEKDYRLTKGTGWLEILGCGMVDPAVLENCGIDSTKYTGFAFGMGIERQALRLYDIGDIRLFFENDVRFLKQFASTI
ncbi:MULTISPECIES: phenylalanine--tRNA ligase subunit alpha [Phaeodactylibacter]|jgi:phenylalanyl-tRNA synthetase alpha chain|uniref:phenylalanine--tRNA ligase subunit alpha n=2 Tax=Phaeodactylibacter TaxID=1564515 RepID=UPI0024A8E877|nr:MULTISPECIES: phenylalanine--tRNA ligase subunit alpha [Phaeodactylibacter]MCI4650438.1 phenylalanine--tRNA ligase subunit alpha [Phaeodactylibacter sp.]MCI5093848.1 phenylalanine--tRNA ligase subunit alpha [Phaeodactylibacter sp.]